MVNWDTCNAVIAIYSSKWKASLSKRDSINSFFDNGSISSLFSAHSLSDNQNITDGLLVFSGSRTVDLNDSFHLLNDNYSITDSISGREMLKSITIDKLKAEYEESHMVVWKTLDALR